MVWATWIRPTTRVAAIGSMAAGQRLFARGVMNLNRLKVVLDQFGLGADVVQYGGLPSEVFVIEPIENKWRIFYSERGIRTSEQIFDRESDAVDAFLEFLSSDSSIVLARRET